MGACRLTLTLRARDRTGALECFFAIDIFNDLLMTTLLLAFMLLVIPVVYTIKAAILRRRLKYVLRMCGRVGSLRGF